MKKEVMNKIYGLAEIFGATGNVEVVFGEDLKEVINELIADNLDADEIVDRIICKQVSVKNDVVEVDVKDDDVFLGVYGDSEDSYHNMKDYIDPVVIMNAIKSSKNSFRYEEVTEVIEKIRELI